MRVVFFFFLDDIEKSARRREVEKKKKMNFSMNLVFLNEWEKRRIDSRQSRFFKEKKKNEKLEKKFFDESRFEITGLLLVRS